jgi:hypothetical protein
MGHTRTVRSETTSGRRARLLWVLSGVFGAGVMAFVVWFGGAIPTETCTGPLPPGFSALLAYQLARSPADIEAVFGPVGDPCRAAMIVAMDRANTVDLVGFIATYGAFLAFFFVALLRSGAGAAARVGLVAVAAAIAFDILETATQLYITGGLPGSAASLTLLALGSTGKFLALALVCACAGLAMIAHGRMPGRLAGAACLAGGLLVVLGLASSSSRTLLSAGNALAWIVMLLYATASAARPPH